MFEGKRCEEKPDFESLYEECYDRLYSYVYSILLNRENAEDIVAETFFSVFSAYDRYDPRIASPLTWLTRIAHNQAINLVKSAAYSKTDPLDEFYDEAAAGNMEGDVTDRVDAHDLVLRLYARLTKAEREFLNLRYGMELSDAKIAALYNLSVNTVNKRYQRLLARCRKTLEEGEKNF